MLTIISNAKKLLKHKSRVFLVLFKKVLVRTLKKLPLLEKKLRLHSFKDNVFLQKMSDFIGISDR